MKTYIKPTTSVENIALTQMVCASTKSVTVNNTQADNVTGTAKERDVWSDGFWN